MKMITLKNGTEEASPLVLGAMMSLRDLIRQNPIAFYEFVQLCRDPNHRLFGNTGEILEKFNLVQNAVVHDSLRNIVLSTVEGDGLNMRLTSPVTTT